MIGIWAKIVVTSNQGNSQGRPPGCLGQPDQQDHLGAEQNQQDRSRPVFVQQLADRQLCERGDGKNQPRGRADPGEIAGRRYQPFIEKFRQGNRDDVEDQPAKQRRNANDAEHHHLGPHTAVGLDVFFWGGASALDRKFARR